MIAKQIAKRVTLLMDGSAKKITTWIAKSRKYTCARPIRSETHAQDTRPRPLKMEMTMTIVAAATGAIWIMSCAMGEAMLMIMMPAETFSKSMNHRSQ